MNIAIVEKEKCHLIVAGAPRVQCTTVVSSVRLMATERFQRRMARIELPRLLLLLLLLSLLGDWFLLSVEGFSEHLEAAEEENQFDDRTLLDMFGEGAKEFLTKQVVRNRLQSDIVHYHCHLDSFIHAAMLY